MMNATQLARLFAAGVVTGLVATVARWTWQQRRASNTSHTSNRAAERLTRKRERQYARDFGRAAR